MWGPAAGSSMVLFIKLNVDLPEADIAICDGSDLEYSNNYLLSDFCSTAW